MLFIAQKLNSLSESKGLGICLLVLLCIGSITPATEMIRTFRGELSVLAGETSARNDPLDSVFTKDGNECYENFIGNADSIFFSLICKE